MGNEIIFNIFLKSLKSITIKNKVPHKNFHSTIFHPDTITLSSIFPLGACVVGTRVVEKWKFLMEKAGFFLWRHYEAMLAL